MSEQRPECLLRQQLGGASNGLLEQAELSPEQNLRAKQVNTKPFLFPLLS